MPFLHSFDGVRMYYEVDGEGKPMLLLHGSPGQISNWKYVRSMLRYDYRLIIPDLRGYGRSDKPEIVHLEDYVKDIRMLLEELAVIDEEVTLVGHSFGSMVAMEYAASRDVRALVMIGPALTIPKSLTDWFILHFPAFLWKPVLFSNNPLTRRMYHSLFFSPKTDKAIYTEFIKDNASYIESLPPQTFRYLARMEYNGQESAGKVRTRTLIMVGEDDRVTPPNGARRLAELIERAELRVIPEAGHMVLYEKPGKIVAAIKEFLNRGVH